MRELQELLLDYVVGVQFPDVSGFEILELRDVRSRLAELEDQFDAVQREKLEAADEVFLRDAPAFYASLAALGSVSDLRRRAGAPCSHGWWYLEKLAQREPVET